MNREPRNNHHAWFPRREMKTPIERRIRNMGAFITNSLVSNHNELHANTPPPPKLTSEQYHNLYNFMQDHTYEMGSLEGLEWAIVWSNDRKLYELEDNLLQQHYYLSGQHLDKTV